MLIEKIGHLIEHVKECVAQWGASAHTTVVVRCGEHGAELPIECVKMRNTALGPIIILQTKQPS